MRTIWTMLTLILALGLPLVAVGGDLPPQAQRIWAPDGDDVGGENQATLTFMLNDDHGDVDLAAENNDILDKWFGQTLFGWGHRMDNGRRVRLTGLLDTFEGSSLGGDFALSLDRPGVCGVDLVYNAHDLHYDRDSEQRNAAFPVVVPATLGDIPQLEWRRGGLAYNRRLSDALGLKFGALDLRRKGTKSSLTAQGPPGVQTLDTAIYELWLGGDYRIRSFSTGLRLSYLGSTGDRAYATGRSYDDDHDRYTASAEAALDVNPDLRFLAHGAMARLEHSGTEQSGETEGDTDRFTGQVGLVARVCQATTLRASVRCTGQDTKAQITRNDGVLYAADRSLDRYGVQLAVGNASLPHTRLHLKYRYRQGESSDTNTEGELHGPDYNGIGQFLDQESTRNDLSFRARTRFSRNVKFKVGISYSDLTVDQTRTWNDPDPVTDDPMYSTLGDYKRSRAGWNVGLQLRPYRWLPIDFGYQGRDQSFKRTDDLVETTCETHRFRGNVNMLAWDRLTVFGMASYGTESYQLTGSSAPAAGFDAFNVNATTLRVSPGAVLQVTGGVQIEGWYEGVFFEDTGDVTSVFNALKSDRDRLQVGARWQMLDSFWVLDHPTLSCRYARNEFDANLWDDYIQHLYTASAQFGF